MELEVRGVRLHTEPFDQTRFGSDPDPEVAELRRQRARAVGHALAEFELPTYGIGPDQPLGEALA